MAAQTRERLTWADSLFARSRSSHGPRAFFYTDLICENKGITCELPISGPAAAPGKPHPAFPAEELLLSTSSTTGHGHAGMVRKPGKGKVRGDLGEGMSPSTRISKMTL